MTRRPVQRWVTVGGQTIVGHVDRELAEAVAEAKLQEMDRANETQPVEPAPPRPTELSSDGKVLRNGTGGGDA